MGRVSIEQYEEGKQRAVWVISCRAVGGASTKSSMGSLSASPHDSLCLQQEWNMGQRASDTRGITFEDVEVPAEVSPVPDCLVCVLLSAGACSRPVCVCLVCVLGSGACSGPVFVLSVCCWVLEPAVDLLMRGHPCRKHAVSFEDQRSTRHQ